MIRRTTLVTHGPSASSCRLPTLPFGTPSKLTSEAALTRTGRSEVGAVRRCEAADQTLRHESLPAGVVASGGRHDADGLTGARSLPVEPPRAALVGPHPRTLGRKHVDHDEGKLAVLLDRHRVWLATNGAEGARAELAGARLRAFSLRRADLRRANLVGADLGWADLDHARLGGASLGGACLAAASLRGADLVGADLTAADLRGAKLDRALLSGAALHGAVLSGTSFRGALLGGVDLSNAVGLVPSQLEPASRNAATRLPAPPPPLVDTAAASERASREDGAPVTLDGQREMLAQEVTEVLRRHLAAFEVAQKALQQRQAELEHLLAAPALCWEDAAGKARYLLALFAATPEGHDPRRHELVAAVLADFRRLASIPRARG